MSPDRREQSDLEQELRSARPRAPRRFIGTLAAAARPARSGFRGRRPLTVALVGAASLAVMGGIGFAASTAIESSQVAVKRVAADGAREIAVRNAASAAYVDPGQVRTADGPPQLTVAQRTDRSGNPVPVVAKATKNDPDVTLNTSLTVNESGTLSIQVLDADGIPVTIDCKRTTVQGGEVGTTEAKICRVVINTPTALQISIKVPSRNLDSGEELTIRLGYTDKDASAKRTIVDTPAKAPATLPTVTRTFRLSSEDIADIREARADGTLFQVTFRASVSKQRTSFSITWGSGPAVNDTASVTRLYSRAADVPRSATVTVTGGEIGGGDFVITDTSIEQSILILDGARNGDRIETFGSSTGFPEGAILRPWIRFPGETGFSQGTANILVDAEGDWSWGRKTGKRTAVQIRSEDGLIRSNTVIIEAR